MAAISEEKPGGKYKCVIWLNVNNGLTKTLVDTGATSSAVSLSFLNAQPPNSYVIKRETERACVSVNSQILKSLYTVLLPIKVGKEVFKHEFEVIANLIEPALLGTDFLKCHDVKLDFALNKIQIKNNFIDEE